MKDAYSFDMDAAGLDVSYRKHYDAYCRIFDRCGLKYMVVEADSGAMGGKESHEFMVRTPAGEDQIVSCDACKYAANLEKATSRLDTVEELKPEGDGKPLLVHTPAQKTIEDVARFLGVSPKNKIKTLAYMAGFIRSNGIARVPILVFLRGDHMLNDAKLRALVGADELNLMEPDEMEKTFHAPAGYLGPTDLDALTAENFAFVRQRGILPESVAGDEHMPDPGTNVRRYYAHPAVIVDAALEGRKNLICGANKEDYHLKNVTPGNDFHPTAYADLRAVTAGEACPNCGKPLRIDTAVEIGHIFKLGYRYSESMGARVLDKNGKEVTPIMGSYGIGIERILTAAVEQGNDENGFWLPPQIAPFEVVVAPVNTKDEAVKSVAEDIARRLEGAGFDVILDDRDERPGVKFKDADLVGIPFRITVGKRVTEGTVEVVQRSTLERRDVTITAVVEYFQGLLGRTG